MSERIESEGIPSISNPQARKKQITLGVGIVAGVLLVLVLALSGHASHPKQEVTQTPSFKMPAAPMLAIAPKMKQSVPAENPEPAVEDTQAARSAIYKRLSAPTLVLNVPHRQAAPKMMSLKQKQATKKITQARALGSLRWLMTQGTLIHATLESAISSDFPGELRAMVNHRIYSADGTQILLRPGDRIIMHYQSAQTQGATRILAMGTRIITAQGLSIDLNAPIGSPLGVMGIAANHIDRHFFERFGTSSLLALISAGAATIGVGQDAQFNSADSYRQKISQAFGDSATQSLKTQGDIKPTLSVHQGQELTIFVAKDISFSQARAGKEQ